MSSVYKFNNNKFEFNNNEFEFNNNEFMSFIMSSVHNNTNAKRFD